MTLYDTGSEKKEKIHTGDKNNTETWTEDVKCIQATATGL